ncbi:hypothetical protein GCM10017673_32800 [Streptosporangium violaceochromogenes]|nr:hypothetical protein GCM10017673_32800 [Streptosporangium violaceochromogenes]
MTTAAERAAPTEVPEREAGEERTLETLLLTALAARREQGAGTVIEHPLLLAALMRRREEGGENIIENPLLLAALACR